MILILLANCFFIAPTNIANTVTPTKTLLPERWKYLVNRCQLNHCFKKNISGSTNFNKNG